MTENNPELLDAAIRHQVFLERYNSGVVRRMLAHINRTDADIVRRLRDLDDGFTRDRLDTILSQIRGLQVALREVLRKQLADELVELADYEADFQFRTQGAIVGAEFNRVTLERVRAAALSRPFQGAHLRWAKPDEHMTEFARRRQRLVRETIAQGFTQGDTVQQIIGRVRGTRSQNFRDGVLEVNRRTAETLVRTAVNHTANSTREAFFQTNKDVFSGVLIAAVLDSRTSVICGALDGNVYDVGEGPRPPFHPNCRTTTVGVLRGEEPPALRRYDDWLRDQDVATQREILGPSRFKLFSEGGLPLSKFIDRKNAPLDLAALARTETAAFRRAGVEI